MSSRARRLARAGAPSIAAVLVFGGLVILLAGSGGESRVAAWHSVTMAFLLSPLLWIVPGSGSSTSGAWRGALDRGLRGLLTLCVAIPFLARGAPEGSAGTLMLLAASWAALLTGLLLVERTVLGGRIRGWLVCSAAVTVVLAPFCLDALLSSRWPVESVVRWRDLVLEASPGVAAARALELDLFKVEGVYRRCLVGEQIFGYPDPPVTARSYVLLAALLAILAAIPALGRRPPGETSASA